MIPADLAALEDVLVKLGICGNVEALDDATAILDHLARAGWTLTPQEKP